MPVITALQLIWKYWQYALIGVLFLLVMTQHFVLLHADAQLDRDKAMIEKLYDANSAFDALVKKQDAALTELKADADRRAKLAQAAVDAAAESQKKYAANALRIQTMPLTGDPCTAAHALFTDYLKGVRP